MGRYNGVELADIEVGGESVTLRPWTATDAARVYEIMQDTAMHEFLALPAPYTRADAAAYVGGFGDEGRAEGTGVGSALVETGTGRVVGSGALRLIGDPEIGYWTAPDARGHGYAAQASRVLAEFAFDLGCTRVRIGCDVRNLASARTALAAGFRFEGVSRGAVTSGGFGDTPPRIGDLARFARLATDSGAPIPPASVPLPQGGLDDGTIALRPIRPDDAQALVDTEDEVSRGFGFTTYGRTADDIAAGAAQAGLDWLVGRVARMAIEDRATRRLAGTLDLRVGGPPDVGSLGYGVHPDFRGRGYTARALRLLVPWAFDVAGFARLELGAKTANVASQRAAARAGFQPAGVRTARLRNPDGSFSDEVCFALVNPRVQAARAARAEPQD